MDQPVARSRQPPLDGIAAFVAVAETSSFSGAAIRMRVSPSAISQSVRALELRLGAALFNRTTRSVSLTEAGRTYLQRVAPLLRELAAASEEAADAAGRPAGLLRLNVPRAAYMTILRPALARFLAAYPDIDIELVIENGRVDIVARGFDAGIRFGDLVEKDMVVVPVGPPLSAHVIASPAYLAARGTPEHPRDLLEHDCVTFWTATSGQIERWAFAKDDEQLELAVHGRLIVNDSTAMAQSVLDGVGIGYMSNGFIERFLEEGRLVRLLADWSPQVPGLTLYYASRRRVPRKLRAFIDFLRHDRELPPPAVDAILR